MLGRDESEAKANLYIQRQKVISPFGGAKVPTYEGKPGTPPAKP